ncbi:hypothetical protein NC652_013500 [Populus alba x Populus x berolinensis]|nr:hypothetical protein NC652_013500 [Populus alba x Populus x berolinensis]
MEEDGCMPNYCSYNVIIRGFLLHKDTSKARKLNEMVNRGFSADSDTKTLLGDLFPVDGSAALKKLLVPSEGCQAITYHDPGSTFAGASLVCIATPFDNLEPESLAGVYKRTLSTEVKLIDEMDSGGFPADAATRTLLPRLPIGAVFAGDHGWKYIC